MDSIAEYLIKYQGFILLGLIAAGVRLTYSKETISLKKLFLVLFATLFLIGVSIEYISEEIDSKGLRTVVIGFIALSAPDIIDFIFKAWTKIKEDPVSILRELADRFLGRGRKDD